MANDEKDSMGERLDQVSEIIEKLDKNIRNLPRSLPAQRDLRTFVLEYAIPVFRQQHEIIVLLEHEITELKKRVK